MSKRFRRALLRDFRKLAELGYPGKVDGWGLVTIPIRPRQRWRWTVRNFAKAQRWRFIDVWINVRFGRMQ